MIECDSLCASCTDPEGGQGGPDPPANHKAIGFLNNTGPEHLENHTASKPAFNIGPSWASQRNIILNGVSLAGR